MTLTHTLAETKVQITLLIKIYMITHAPIHLWNNMVVRQRIP